MVKMTKWVKARSALPWGVWSGSGRGAGWDRGSEACPLESTAQRVEAGWAGVRAQGAISHRLTLALALALVLTEGGRELPGSP